MTYTNTPAVVSQQTTSYSSGNIPYTSIALLENIPHSAQLEVERIFVVDRDGSAATLLAFLADTAVTTAQKKAVFIIPISRCTLNTATKNISSINLPASGDVYNYVITTPTPTTYTIKVPILSSSTVTVRRKTVSNEPLVNWVPGSRLTSKQLNLATTQSLYLLQEAIEKIGTSLTLAATQITVVSLADAAVTPSKISTTTDPWSFYGTIQTVAPTANLHATTRLYTLDKFFQHGVMTKDDVAPTSSAVDILETAATAGNSGLWFNPKNGTINLWAGNAWVTVAGTPVTTANLVSTNTVQTLTAAKTFAAGTVVPFTQTGSGAVARTVDAKLKDTVSVKDFGAVGNGVADDTAAIQLALSSGNKAIYFPTGTYVVSSQLNITPNTTISGDGIGATVINGTTLSSGFVFSCIGTALVSVGTIATASKSNFLFNLVSAPSPALEKFDVVVIWNPTTFSWNTARANYRQGEFVTVQEVSGTTINTTSALYDTYTTATDVYKMTNASCSIKNLTIIAPQISASVLGSIKLQLLVNSCIEKVKITGGTTTSIFFDKCYNSEVVSCDISDNLILDPSDDYALSIGSCQAMNITNCFVKARGGHTITLGGNGEVGSVVGREITISNCSIHSETGFAADMHGNTEFCSYVNCNISGGMVLAGNNNSVIGCSIRGQLPTLELIRVYENKGLDFRFINNKLETISSTSSVFLLETQAYTVLGGTVLLQGNTVIATNSTTSGIISVRSSNTSITDNHVVITGNTFNGSSSANLEYVQVIVGSTASVTGSPWSSVSFTNNICSDTVNFVIAATGTVADIIAKEVYISENKMYGATSRSLTIKGINKLIVKSNVFVNSLNSAVWVDGNSYVTLANAALVDVSGNTFIDCVTSAPAASTSLDSDITVVNTVVIITNGNNHYNSNATKPRVMEYIRGTTLYNGNYALTYTPRTATTDVGATVVVAI